MQDDSTTNFAVDHIGKTNQSIEDREARRLGQPMHWTKPWLAKRKLSDETSYIPSNFEFLKAINGFRPGKVHVIVGLTGVGKTTLTISLLPYVAQHAGVAVILTEEMPDDIAIRWAEMCGDDELLGYKARANHEDLVFEAPDKSENSPFWGHDNDTGEYVCINPYAFIDERLTYFIKEHRNQGRRLVVIDNITTAKRLVGDLPRPTRMPAPSSIEMVKFIDGILHRNAIKYQVGILVIVHAHSQRGKAGGKTKLLQEEDFFGPSIVAKTAEFVWGYNMLKIGDDNKSWVAIVNCIKDRVYNSPGHLFELSYDHTIRTYVSDKKVGKDHVDMLLAGANAKPQIKRIDPPIIKHWTDE